jgi:uncharacterized membrane protein YhiD involved in acid resistance
MRTGRLCLASIVLVSCLASPVLAIQGSGAKSAAASIDALPGDQPKNDETRPAQAQEMATALIRLPLAAVLGAALALRPKRRGTPTRTPAVVQTQIILAMVGALIMLVVGASLARAFGIVGAANLIRYRSKIDDPKDAGVMLCCLAVGLASGVGLFGLTIFSTGLLVIALWILESFEPRTLKPFELTVKTDHAEALRPKIEAALKARHVKFEMRAVSDDALSYLVRVPLELHTDLISNDLVALGAKQKIAVEWSEKKVKSS